MKKTLLYFLLLLLWGTGQFSCYSQCSLSTELVVNGDFENCGTDCALHTLPTGNPAHSSFTSGSYTKKGCSGGADNIWAGNYAITKDASQCFSCWYGSGTGNTSHGGNYAMLIDGNELGNVWCQTVAVTAGSTYQFSAWYKNAVTSSCSPGNIPSLQLTVNGSPITGAMASVDYLAGWNQNTCFWQAPAGTSSATLCITVSATSGSSGNDLLIDDISFRRITSGSCTAGTCTYTLPVELISFTASRIGNRSVLLNWKTASEINSSHFIVERSLDGKTFENAGKVKANGNSNLTLSYSLTDEIPPDYPGSLYYRLLMADIDGTFKYSEIKKISLEDTTIEVFPNPSSRGDELKIYYYSDEQNEISITMLNSIGKAEYHKDHTLSAGSNMLTIATTQMAPGLYIIEVSAKERKTYIKVIIE
jgi:hypothetical protein